MEEHTRELDIMLGDPKAAIRYMSVPMMVSFLVAQVNLFADASWCSGLGVDASSGVSTIYPMYIVLTGLGTGLGVGASTAIARRLGKEAKAEADSLAVQSVLIGLAVSLTAIPLVWFTLDPLIDWLGASDVRAECRAYIDPMVLSGMFIVMNGTIAGILRAEGAAKKAMAVLSSTALVNIVLDPILIYGFGMGLAGAGTATAAGTIVSTLMGAYWYASGKMYVNISFRNLKVKRSDVSDILYVGIPRAGESMFGGIIAILQRVFVIACGGTVAAVYYDVPWRLVSLACVVSLGIGSALVPVCSAALGAGRFDRAEEGYRYSLKVTTLFMSAVAVLLFVFADLFVLPFTLSPSMAELRPEFVHILRIYAPVVICLGLIDIGSGILQSLRKAQMSLYASMARNLLVLFALYFASQWSLDAIYWTVVATQVIGAAIMMGLAHWQLGLARKAAVRRRLVGRHQ